jgi:galactan 5-O-arabinofuranosyltransferase
MGIAQSVSRRLTVYAPLLLFLTLGIYLFRYALIPKVFTDDLLVRDLIWLDAWALAFFFVTVAIWCSSLSRRAKAVWSLSCLAVYGFITVALIFDGTPFGLNAYWGDKKLRTAMVLQYMSSAGWPDVYYKGLPTFYPPLYYFLLSLWARVFNLEAYKLMKIGTLMIYLGGPFVLYYLWRRIVSPFQAFLITLFTFLFCSSERAVPIVSPHAFVGNSMFIPWWLYYIERVRDARTDWRYYLSGSVIGGVIFMTYFYAFFIGALLLVLRLTLLRRWQYLAHPPGFRLARAWPIAVGTAVVSAPYWLPLLLSLVRRGFDPSWGGWHHSDSTGITFAYLSFSLPSLVFLASICYALRRARTPLYRGLLLLTGAITAYYLPGAILGALDKPVNLIKAADFVPLLAGPFIGLGAAALLSWAHHRRRSRWAVWVLVSLMLIVFLSGFNRLAKVGAVETARKATRPTWGLDKQEMAARRGSVFLTGVEELFAFQPVYAFIALNHHYSNASSRFLARFDFLRLLQEVTDPQLFNAALRHNVFDRVDYFMPVSQNDKLEIPVSLSNYPNKHVTQRLTFDSHAVSDTAFFAREKGDNLYRVKDAAPVARPLVFPAGVRCLADSLTYTARLRMISDYLDPIGQQTLDRSLAAASYSLLSPAAGRLPHSFADSIRLKAMYAVTTADSTYFIFAFEALKNIVYDYRFYFHVTPRDGKNAMRNFDFSAPSPTSTWRRGDLVLAVRTVPRIDTDLDVLLGPFAGDVRLGQGFKGRFSR